MNGEVKESEFELKKKSSTIGEYKEDNEKLREKNELMIEDSNEKELKSKVIALESFTSLHQTFDTQNMNMTIVLSALIALLVTSFIHISTQN